MKNLFTPALLAFCTLLLSIAPATAQFSTFQPASNVLGQLNLANNAPGSGLNRTFNPRGAVVDRVTGKIFVSDQGNNRILRFASAAGFTNNASAEAVFGGGGAPSATTLNVPAGIDIDAAGRLWVADLANNRILRFDNAATIPSGSPASAVLGQIDFINSDPATTQNGLHNPIDVSVDAAGRLWVAETTNNRVLRFDNAASKPDGANADGVLGQPNFTSTALTTTATGTRQAYSVHADASGRLWVADAFNNRVLRFDNAALKANGASADGVLGQPNFGTATPAATANNMNAPIGVHLDLLGRLYVGDGGNHRVMIFMNAASLPDGAAASEVLGQPGPFIGVPNNGGLSAFSLNGPALPFFDETNNSLYVGDFNNNRVLRYAAAAPTAAGVAVSGRVTNGKSGLVRAIVSVTGGDGVTRTAKTSSFGYYRFENLPAGETYIFNAQAKGFAFAPQVVTLNEAIENLDFRAIE
jgi:hypothetical protein